MANAVMFLQRSTAAVLLVLAVVPLLPNNVVKGQEQGVESIQWKRGYNGLAMLCRTASLRIDNDLRRWRDVPAKRSMLIILGPTRGLPVDVIDFVNAGGAVLVASDQQDYESLIPWGVALNRGPHRAVATADTFRKRSDCPVATDLDRDHPVMQGCKSLVTNRPGLLALPRGLASRDDRFRRTIANLPVLQGQPRTSARRPTVGPPLVAALDWNSDGRALCVADQSMFSNQMLTCGDNANFAVNTISWLRAGTRTNVLIIADRQVLDPTNPDQLFVLVPPPNPEDVIAALEELPPEALIAFSNSVIAAVEDEGVVNDVIPDILSEMSHSLYMRILILLATTGLLLSLAIGLFRRRTQWLEGTAARRKDRRQASSERQQAAALLLDQFRGDLTGKISTPWERLARSIRIDGAPGDTNKVRRDLARNVRRFQRRKPRYWTRRRLERLQQQIAGWRQLRASGLLEYHPG